MYELLTFWVITAALMAFLFLGLPFVEQRQAAKGRQQRTSTGARRLAWPRRVAAGR
jgi:hypothetical protein